MRGSGAVPRFVQKDSYSRQTWQGTVVESSSGEMTADNTVEFGIFAPKLHLSRSVANEIFSGDVSLPFALHMRKVCDFARIAREGMFTVCNFG